MLSASLNKTFPSFLDVSLYLGCVGWGGRCGSITCTPRIEQYCDVIGTLVLPDLHVIRVDVTPRHYRLDVQLPFADQTGAWREDGHVHGVVDDVRDGRPPPRRHVVVVAVLLHDWNFHVASIQHRRDFPCQNRCMMLDTCMEERKCFI